MDDVTDPQPVTAEDVDVYVFAVAVARLVDEWHRQPDEWIRMCTCGERWPCRTRNAWQLGAKAMFAALKELDQLRADRDAA